MVSGTAVWKFLDNGSDPGPDWTSLEFDDSQWSHGPAELGYGDGDEATVVNCGPDRPICRTNTFATTYFRHIFDTNALGIAEVNLTEVLNAELLRNDAAAVYLNGNQIFRDPTLPAGADYTTFATQFAPREVYTASFGVNPALLRNGRNVLAAEVHQVWEFGPDASFNLSMAAVVAIPEPRSICLSAAALLLVAIAYTFRRSRRP